MSIHNWKVVSSLVLAMLLAFGVGTAFGAAKMELGDDGYTVPVTDNTFGFWDEGYASYTGTDNPNIVAIPLAQVLTPLPQGAASATRNKDGSGEGYTIGKWTYWAGEYSDLHPIEEAGTPLPPNEMGVPTMLKAVLGEKAFFDGRYSGDTSTPCSKCHDPAQGFGTFDDVSTGYPSIIHWRNSHTTMNNAWHDKFFWDGRSLSLDSQAEGANTGSGLAGNATSEHMLPRHFQSDEYTIGFFQEWNAPPSIAKIDWAIDIYERITRSDPNVVPFDMWMNGDEDAISDEAKRGAELFNGEWDCVRCHFGPHGVGTQDFYSLGLPRIASFDDDPLRQETVRYIDYGAGMHGIMDWDLDYFDDLGIGMRTHLKQDLMHLKTQQLRELCVTPPYFHQGTHNDLDEVVRFHLHGGGNPYLKDADGRGADFAGWRHEGREGEDPGPGTGGFPGTVNYDRPGKKGANMKVINDPADEDVDAMVAFLESMCTPEEEGSAPWTERKVSVPRYSPPLYTGPQP